MTNPTASFGVQVGTHWRPCWTADGANRLTCPNGGAHLDEPVRAKPHCQPKRASYCRRAQACQDPHACRGLPGTAREALPASCFAASSLRLSKPARCRAEKVRGGGVGVYDTAMSSVVLQLGLHG
jgi:hypothetical protein